MIPGFRVFPLYRDRRESRDPRSPPAAVVAVPAPTKMAARAARAAAGVTAFETEERARAAGHLCKGWWQDCPCSTR